MIFLAETRKVIINLFKSLLLATTIFYFSYHMVSGEKGILAMINLTQQINSAEMEANKIRIEREEIEHRVNMMSPKSLDADLLDEQARHMLGYKGKGEVVYIEKWQDNKSDPLPAKEE